MLTNWYLGKIGTFEETKIKSNEKFLFKNFFQSIYPFSSFAKRFYSFITFYFFRYDNSRQIYLSKY